MKVLFDGVSLGGESEDSIFATQLARSFAESGIDLADPDDYDVALVFDTKNARIDFKKPFVIRYKDIFGDTPFYSHAHSVVFRSKLEAHHAMTKRGCPNDPVVVHDGLSMKRIGSVYDVVANARNSYEKIFSCHSSSWSDADLADHLLAYRSLRDSSCSSCLFVIGEVPWNSMDRRSIQDNIFYIISQPHDVRLQIFAASDWFIHLSRSLEYSLTVLESLSQETPIIYSPGTAVQEVVGRLGVSFGTALDSGLPKLVDLDLQRLDVGAAASYYAELLEKAIVFDQK